ncbi:SDR family NAD(P)-dependent oxidoreductase [Sphingomonas radiodurans]|uniref:SDR family NAD(P)-dependent oxidoreductase n=1 Tax=Sphingomonas radiodurans TaxID=2890321 RepID=UPI001E320E8C|nr:SDR family oxidoreductase [Sphingomonas radiodurans]WBH17757.1 SDR family oxidoreductase [Sphingomonas radiodurans]
MERYRGKVALVTGGTSGIGAATVGRLAREGAQVLFTGRNAAAGAAVAAETGGEFLAHSVEDAEGWGEVEARLRAFGRLDLAFANAGMEGGDTNIEDVAVADWNAILAVNLTGPMLTAQTAIRVMRDNPDGPSGAIVINSSISGMLGLAGNVGYTATKGGARLLAKSVAMHCAARGYRIRCNAILPGVVATALIEGAIAGAPDPAAARTMLEGVSPMKRMATLEEIAGLVAFLGSDDAAFITGADYVVDGGATAGMAGV